MKLIKNLECVNCGMYDTAVHHEEDGYFRCNFCGYEFDDDSIDTRDPNFQAGLQDGRATLHDEVETKYDAGDDEIPL